MTFERVVPVFFGRKELKENFFFPETVVCPFILFSSLRPLRSLWLKI